MRVLCVNDKNQPKGAEVESGKEYKVKEEVFDTFGTPAYLIEGIRNQGLTDKGLNWFGYAAHRFVPMEEGPNMVGLEMKEEEFSILN